ncbi:mitogen-activated protein kinase kinase kinase 2-like [Prunus persica]|uniref:mitogen-activated protein kinase kinase kinase 2-like n=1 Tax=Prunus persica TaxID=3760 RepID=UPI0009AB92F0|nr:mitogen-activated protein kinase kinase kinase 2-like [Prunus persica]
MAVKSAKVSASESIKHESDVLLEIKGCPFIIERLGEETTATDKGDMVYNLLLEFASGGTLDGLIHKSKGHKLSEYDVRRYTRSILEGIQHIHKYDYVHCDLKPDNILLLPTTTTSSGGTSFVAKIADFGLAKKTKVNYSRWRGTPRYLSPEAFINNKQDQSSDIWSLGCIVFEMLTGKSPWDLKPGYNPNNFPDVLMFDHLRTCKLPTGISDMARDFLKSCLAMNSRERLTAESLLSHPFVAQPQSSKEGHTKVKLINSFLGYASGQLGQAVYYAFKIASLPFRCLAQRNFVIFVVVLLLLGFSGFPIAAVSFSSGGLLIIDMKQDNIAAMSLSSGGLLIIDYMKQDNEI